MNPASTAPAGGSSAGGSSAGAGAAEGASPVTARVRVRLPTQLQKLAQQPAEIVVQVDGAVTQRAVIDALEREHPVLSGAVRDRATGKRRPFVRFFAGELDLSNAPPDEPLPAEVCQSREPFVVLGAIAGG